MGSEDQPIGYLSGVHHAPHSYIGVAASKPSACIIPAREGRLLVVQVLMRQVCSVLWEGGGRSWRSSLVVSLAKGAIPFQIVTRYPHLQHLLVDGYKS